MNDVATYRAWKEHVFGSDYMIWHDGLYTGAVTGLVGAAREEALAMLRFGLSEGDAHASQALAAMGDMDSLESIRDQIATKYGSEKVRAALAAHRMAADERLAAHLVDVMQRAPNWSDRIDAAIGLCHFAERGSESALLEAIERDPDYLVRYHACETLLARWGVTPTEIAQHRAIFERIIGARDVSPGPEHFARFREARGMMEALRRSARS